MSAAETGLSTTRARSRGTGRELGHAHRAVVDHRGDAGRGHRAAPVQRHAAGQRRRLHLLYRRLYYVPILYAAFVFGKRGGFLTALAASVPFALQAQMSLGGVWRRVRRQRARDRHVLRRRRALRGAARHGGAQDARSAAGESAPRGRVQEARGACDPADQHPGLHAVDPALDHLRRAHGRTGRLGDDGQPGRRAHARCGRVRHRPRPIDQVFADDGGLSARCGQGALGAPAALACARSPSSRAAGRRVHVQASTSRMRAVGGRILGAVVTIEDVSEIKALTEQLITGRSTRGHG